MEYLKFTGTGSEYFKIWIVNILLTIITLGFYTPWAKVRNRRYFYANATLANRNFEYHATGKQLLLGFIIGVILFIIYTFVTQIAPQFAIVFMLLFMLIFPWLIWKSLMFNMKMTSFSNVHFSFRGTVGTAYKIFLGYPLLVFAFIMLLGVLVSIVMPSLQNLSNGESSVLENISPMVLTAVGTAMGVLFFLGYIYFFAFMKKQATSYHISNTFYGQGKFETELETKKFFAIIFKSILLAIIPSLLVWALVYFATLLSIDLHSGMEIIFVVAYFGFLILMMVLSAYVVAREREYVYNHTLLDNEIAFTSTLRARDLAWVMVSNIFMIMFTLGLAFPWAKVRVARLMLENTMVDTANSFDDFITEEQNHISSIGDQIGDAFDVDVGVAF